MTLPSIIVDLEGASPPVFGSWDVVKSPGVPLRVTWAMLMVAWARGECCPFNISGGRLELHGRFVPSAGLRDAVDEGAADVVCIMGFGARVLMGQDRKPYGLGRAFDFLAHGRD